MAFSTYVFPYSGDMLNSLSVTSLSGDMLVSIEKCCVEGVVR